MRTRRPISNLAVDVAEIVAALAGGEPFCGTDCSLGEATAREAFVLEGDAVDGTVCDQDVQAVFVALTMRGNLQAVSPAPASTAWRTLIAVPDGASSLET